MCHVDRAGASVDDDISRDPSTKDRQTKPLPVCCAGLNPQRAYHKTAIRVDHAICHHMEVCSAFRVYEISSAERYIALRTIAEVEWRFLC